MSDLSLAIKLTTEGGQVVVKEISSVGKSAEVANKQLDQTEKSGQKARKGLRDASSGARELDTHMNMLRSTLGYVARALVVFSVGAFFKGTIDEAEQLQRNMLRTESVIRSMGGVAGFTAEQLKEQARQVAFSTLQSTEEVMRAQQVMLTYQSITGETFSEAISLATDLATLMGGNLQQSVEQLGRALDDPDKGLQALARSGYRFSEAQQQMWADMARTGQLAEAQAEIMAELRAQVGGLAENEAKGAAGAKDTFAQSLQEAQIAIDNFLGSGDTLVRWYNAASAGLQELTAMLASGEMGYYLEAIGIQFKELATDIQVAMEFASAILDDFVKGIVGEGGISAILKDAFLNFGANIRAAIQIATVEIAGFVDRTRVWGRRIAYNMDPRNWFGESRPAEYWQEEIERINQVVRDSTSDILGQWEQTRTASQNLREEGKQRRLEWERERAAFDAYTPALTSGFDAIGYASSEAAAIIQRNSRLFLQNMRQETELLRVRLALGEEAYELQKIVQQLQTNDSSTIAQIKEQLALQKALNEEFRLQQELATGGLDDYLDSLLQVGSAADMVGNVLIDTFGSLAKQLDSFSHSQVAFAKAFENLAKKRAEYEQLSDPEQRAQALKRLDAAEQQMYRNQLQAALGNYASITGAAKSMFGEQSKGREALHRMEMAFSIAETAMAMQRAAANALTAITNQGNGDPYSAFGRIAAMAAIMAGLGVFSGSVSGNPNIAAERQANQGTGTVLGSDDKSASIANTLDRIEALELDQYNELRSINQSIRQLNQGIAQLAVNLVRSFGRFDAASYGGPLGTDKQFQLGSGLSSFAAGGAIGLGLDKLLLDGLIGNIFNSIIGGISKTTRSLVDSGLSFEAQQLGDIIATGILEGSYYNVIETTKRKLWGLSKRRSQDTEYTALDNALQQEFGRIFGFIGDSVQQAVDFLGIETNRVLENFVINLPALSFNEMSGDDIQKELEAIFSQQADLMVQYLVPSMAEYQKMGEGLYDTLMRVAQEQAVFNAQLDALGMSLGDLSAALRIDVAQSIIELMGGVEQFRDLTSQFFSSFYSDADQLDYFSRQISQAFSSMGLSVPATREQFKAMVGAIDVTNESGQELFATLMQLVPTLDEYYKALERQADAADKAADAERRLAEQRYGFEMGIWTELSRFDFSPVRKAVDDLQRWYKDSTAEAEQLGADTSLLSTLYNRRLQALAEQTMQQSIDTTRQSMERLVGEFDRGVAQLAATLQQHINAISSMGEQLYADALAIRKTVPGFDAVGYYSNQIASLSAGLGTGSTTEQLDLVARLRNAIGERYSAELAALDEVSTLEHQHYDVAMDAYRSLIRAAESMRDAAAALSIGDLSPLTTGQRLTEARSQFDVALAAARGGDVDAYTQVQSLGQQILQLSRDFNPANYNSVFADIKSVFEELGGVDGVEPTAPAPHPAIAEYEAQKIALAERTIAELVALQSKTDALTPLAQAEYDAGVAALMAEFAAASDAIIVAFETSIAELYALMPNETDKVVAKLEEQIAAIYGMSSDVTGAIHNQSDIVRNQPPPKMPDVIVPPAPPPKVVVSPPPPVNVDTGSVVRELKEVQKHLEKQREQAERHARQQHERMGVVIDTNRMAYREIVDVHHDYMHGVRQVMR